MRAIRLFLAAISLLAVSSLLTFAQHQGGPGLVGSSLRVHVTGPADRPVGQGLRVRVMESGGDVAGESFTDNSGEASFGGLEPGTYHVMVSGEGYAESDSASVELERGQLPQTLYISVHRADTGSGLTVGKSKDATVDVSLLKAPPAARKEFEEGNALLSRQAWKDGSEHLQKAVKIDPEFGAAYNNLAVAYAKLGDRVHEREALDQALKWNDHNEAALLNRAHLYLMDNDLVDGEDLLHRATAINPENPETLMVLAKVQLLRHQYDEALQSASRLHTLPHARFALVHYLAARAFEAKNLPKKAASELQVFLVEEPQGQWSQAARKELGLLEAGSVPRFQADLR